MAARRSRPWKSISESPIQESFAAGMPSATSRLERDGPAPGGVGWRRLEPFAGAEPGWVACHERLAGRPAETQSVLATVGGPAGTAARPDPKPSASRSASANSRQDSYRFSGTLARARARTRSRAPGSSGRRTRTDGGGSERWAMSTADGPPRSNGGALVSRW